MEDININILVEAKNQYTKQLTHNLVSYLYEGIESIFQDANEMESDGKNVLRRFQDLLCKVPKWNQDMIDTEVERILKMSQCNYFDELLKAVFIANARILTVASSVKAQVINVPTIDKFIHRCYIESAREFYKNPYLLDNVTRSYDKHRNLRESLKIIEEAIEEAVRRMLPMRDILNEYLGDNTVEEDITRQVTLNFNKKLHTQTNVSPVNENANNLEENKNNENVNNLETYKDSDTTESEDNKNNNEHSSNTSESDKNDSQLLKDKDDAHYSDTTESEETNSTLLKEDNDDWKKCKNIPKAPPLPPAGFGYVKKMIKQIENPTYIVKEIKEETPEKEVIKEETVCSNNNDNLKEENVYVNNDESLKEDNKFIEEEVKIEDVYIDDNKKYNELVEDFKEKEIYLDDKSKKSFHQVGQRSNALVEDQRVTTHPTHLRRRIIRIPKKHRHKKQENEENSGMNFGLGKEMNVGFFADARDEESD